MAVVGKSCLGGRHRQHLRPCRQDLCKPAYLANGGRIVDARIIAAPKQRNGDPEKQAIKAGKAAGEIRPNTPAKAAQKDVDARWTAKFSKAKPDTDGVLRQRNTAILVFGYKSHASIDHHGDSIRVWAVTSASAHDGAQPRNVPTKDNTASTVWSDSAYRSKPNKA